MLIILQQLKLSTTLNTIIIFIFFLLLNILYMRIFHLREAMRVYWSFRKWLLFIAGIVAGILLVTLPGIAAIISGYSATSNISIGHISAVAAALTFLITSWEELWFRGLLLNYAARYLSPINISLTMGVLFMLIHVLNPAIHLLQNGPVLFLAGALLTALYLYYRSIWVPAGLHFANNFFGSVIHTAVDHHPVFGSEGYIYTMLLLMATVFFLWRLKGKTR